MQEGATENEGQVHRCATGERHLSEQFITFDHSDFDSTIQETSGSNTETQEDCTRLLYEHAQCVGMGIRKHRSSAAISQSMATTCRMQRTFLPGPWIQHILFFYVFLDSRSLRLLSKITKETPKERNRSCNNTGRAGAPLPTPLPMFVFWACPTGMVKLLPVHLIKPAGFSPLVTALSG